MQFSVRFKTKPEPLLLVSAEASNTCWKSDLYLPSFHKLYPVVTYFLENFRNVEVRLCISISLPQPSITKRIKQFNVHLKT